MKGWRLTAGTFCSQETVLFVQPQSSSPPSFEGGRLLVLELKDFACAGPIKAVAKYKTIWHRL